MATYAHQSNGHGIAPKIKLYTNHRCPFAHRAHIVLKELNLPYEEVIIDLDKPREPWYLKINPRGLVPSIIFNNDVLQDETITESAIVSQFLADLRPSHLLPASLESPTAPLFRARVNFFVDTWNTKISPFLFGSLKLEGKEQEEKCRQWVAAIEKEIEPLLEGAAPFFGGKAELTFAETQVAPFVLRMYTMVKGEMLPASFRESLDALPNFSKWAKATMAKESVTYIYNEEAIISGTKKRLAQMKASGN